MKKLFIATLFVSGLSLGFISCNNGAYDADANTDLTTVRNPLDPASGVTVYIGSMKAMVDGKTVIFKNVKYSIDETNTRTMTGEALNDILERSFSMSWADQTYKGASDYKFGTDGGLNFTFNVRDTSIKDIKTYFSYIANNTVGKGNITVTVKGDEDGNMRGTFEGTVTQALPEADENKYIVFKTSEFYAPVKK